MAGRIAGTLTVRVNGESIPLVGNWTFGRGVPQREALLHVSGHGGYFKEMPSVPYIEGEARYTGDYDMEALERVTGAVLEVSLGNGEELVFSNAYAAGTWVHNTEEANSQVRFEAERVVTA